MPDQVERGGESAAEEQDHGHRQLVAVGDVEGEVLEHNKGYVKTEGFREQTRPPRLPCLA